MTLTIELTSEQEAKLQALADASGTDPKTVLLDLVTALPDYGNMPQSGMLTPGDPTPTRKTTAEILAGWDAEGLPSVYERDPEDATVVARRLRKQAESRELLK
jgi:hypothetical protein